jgi:plastocyanin
MQRSLATAAFLAIVAAACSDSTSSSSADLCAGSGASLTVRASDNYTFTPASDTITVGESVCWQNTGKLAHTVTNYPRFSASLPSGQTFVYTIGFGGRFDYYCSIHSTMKGTVFVKCKSGDISC